jgi:hypothetical protein
MAKDDDQAEIRYRWWSIKGPVMGITIVAGLTALIVGGIAHLHQSEAAGTRITSDVVKAIDADAQSTQKGIRMLVEEQRRTTEAVLVNSYISTLTPEQKKALELDKPESLRRR